MIALEEKRIFLGVVVKHFQKIVASAVLPLLDRLFGNVNEITAVSDEKIDEG